MTPDPKGSTSRSAANLDRGRVSAYPQGPCPYIVDA